MKKYQLKEIRNLTSKYEIIHRDELNEILNDKEKKIINDDLLKLDNKIKTEAIKYIDNLIEENKDK
jgi:hypothetical protein